jgi:hypothetical protein
MSKKFPTHDDYMSGKVTHRQYHAAIIKTAGIDFGFTGIVRQAAGSKFEYSDPDDLLEYNQREEEDYFEDREDENYYGPYYPDEEDWY